MILIFFFVVKLYMCFHREMRRWGGFLIFCSFLKPWQLPGGTKREHLSIQQFQGGEVATALARWTPSVRRPPQISEYARSGPPPSIHSLRPKNSVVKGKLSPSLFGDSELRHHAKPEQSFEEGSSRTRQAQFGSSGTGVSGVNPLSLSPARAVVRVFFRFRGFDRSRFLLSFYEFLLRLQHLWRRKSRPFARIDSRVRDESLCLWFLVRCLVVFIRVSLLGSKIKVARSSDGEALPEKIWLKVVEILGK